jgi:putative SOS response-associated peptidase YedK
MINARAESVAEKPSFRSAFKKRRCLVPGDGFYEWKKTAKKKQPFYIRMKDGQPFAFAGLWERWHPPDGKEVETFTIITTEPNDLMRTIHDRMPVILHPKDFEAWLNPGIEDAQRLAHLLRPFPAENMEARPVSARVNSPKNDGPQCLEPAPATESEGLLDFS